MTSRIVATSRQTRFNPLVQGDASEVDLNDVNIAIGEREILVDGRIRLKGGVRYGMIGRNGCGKSTVLQALADRLIPGIPSSLRIHIVSQVDTETSPDNTTGAEGKKEAVAQTALQRVLDGHVERRKALRERAVLEEIIDAEPSRAQGLMDKLMLERKNEELEEARRTALLRSGARGWEARSDEIKAEKELEAAEAKLTKLTVEDDVHLRAAEMLSEVQVTLDLLESDNAESEAIRILRGLGFKEEMMSSPFTSLSGGWRSRCRLATALIVQTDLLILDEPSNFMDLQSILWLEKFLKESRNYDTLVITSHDQVFLDRLSEQTICLRERRLDYFDGTPTTMQTVEAEERVHKEKVVSALDKKREHIESSIQNGRKLAKATGDDARMRSVKSREKKLQDRMGLEKSAKGTRFKLNRDLAGYHLTSRADVVVERAEVELAWKIPPPPEIRGGVLISLENVSVGYGKKVILEGLTLTVFPGSRTAIVGSNGQGKSTLAKLITSDLKPSKGTVTAHPSLRIGYFSQHIVESLNVASPPLAHFLEHFEALGETVTEQTARGFLGGLGLQGRTASHVPIGLLSGGQKVRLALALLLFRPPQLLVLDEVTTHLDAYSIRALARALRSWQGAILLITHDRWFSSVVVERKAMDEDPDGEAGDTVIVSKGKMKKIGGMKEYEEIVARRLARRKDI